MTGDAAVPKFKAAFRLEKRDAETGEVVEVVVGGDDEPTRAILRKPGQPAESYAACPHEPRENDHA